MKRIVISIIVFGTVLYLSSKILSPNDSNSLFIRLLISVLIASVVFWFISVRNENEETDN